jgi:hypothetical protein
LVNFHIGASSLYRTLRSGTKGGIQVYSTVRNILAQSLRNAVKVSSYSMVAEVARENIPSWGDKRSSYVVAIRGSVGSEPGSILYGEAVAACSRLQHFLPDWSVGLLH